MTTTRSELKSIMAHACVRHALILFLLILLPMTLPAATTDQQIKDAVQLLNNKKFSQAMELLHSVESTIANPGDVSELLAVAYLGHGYQLLKANNFAAARDIFFEGRRYKEADVRLWLGEGMCLFKQGQYAEAASLLEEAKSSVPENARLHYLLGQAYYADGRMPEAVDSLTRASELSGGDDVNAFLDKVSREWQVEMDMGREVRGHFQLSFVDGRHTASLAAEIVDTLEEAYAELGSELAYYPDVKIPVLLYSHQDFASITDSPDWAGGVYDGKIRLPLGGINKMSDQLRALLYHEYSHVLVHFMANRNVPVWLNEGLAELSGRRIYAPPLDLLQKAVETQHLLDWAVLGKTFTALPKHDVRLAYEQSFSMVSFMVENYGWHKLTELLVRLGRKEQWQVSMATVYSDYGLNWPAIVSEWQVSLGLLYK